MCLSNTVGGIAGLGKITREMTMRKVLIQLVLPAGIVVVGLLALKSYFAGHVFASAWVDSLRAAAADADRLVVHDLDFDQKGRQPDVEIRGADKIRQLLEVIDIDPAGSGFHCMCNGEFQIHFYQGDRKVLTLGYHHGRSLRWHQGAWQGDGLLTAASQEALPAWFQKNGCAYFQKLRDRELTRKKQQAAEEELFVGFFPQNVRKFLLQRGGIFLGDENDERLGRKIAEVMADGKATAVSVCRALGSVDVSWTTTTEKERRALAAVHTVSGQQFFEALQKLRDDPRGLRGAARVFFREGYHKKIPAKARTEWVVRLAETVFTDGLDDDKPSLLRFLETEPDPQVKLLLRNVFHGKVGREINRAKAFGEEPGLRTGAALALVLLGDDSIKPEIEQMLPQAKAKPDTAALEVCLALLGDASRIKTEHFRLRSYSIGLAGLEAIKRFHGKHGMEALVKGGIRHPWGHVQDEALKTFEQITGRAMSAGEIEDWWGVEHEGKRDRPEPVLRLKVDAGQPRCAVFSPTGDLIASGSNDSTVQVWNAQTGERIHTLRGHGFPVTDVAFHPDGRQLASASSDLTVKVWDLTTGKEVRTLKGHTQFVARLAYSPDGKYLASAGEDSTVRIWDAGTGKLLRTFKGHKHPVKALAFRPDGRRLASVDADKTVQIWNPADGNIERSFPVAGSSVTSIAYQPDGTSLLTTGGSDRSVKLWDTNTGKLLRTFKGHTYYLAGAAFSPDGKQIASAGWDKMIKVWDTDTGKELVSFKGHPEWINHLAYSPDGRRLATASADKTVRVWDLAKILGAVKAPAERK